MATAAKLSIVRKARESRHLDKIESAVRGGGPILDLDVLRSSWIRCTTELLINPDSPTAPHIVVGNELRVFREPLGKAILYVQEEIDRLYAIVRDLPGSSSVEEPGFPRQERAVLQTFPRGARRVGWTQAMVGSQSELLCAERMTRDGAPSDEHA